MPTSAAKMAKRERLKATLAGEETDRTPISFWHHFPGRDRTVEELVRSTTDFQRTYDLDLIKLMPTGMYSTLDYGATVSLAPGPVGTTKLDTTPIGSPVDWARLPVASAKRGELSAQVEVVRRLRNELGSDVAIVQTIFSPLTMANKLAGPAFKGYLESEESSLYPALERFAADVVAFGIACLDAGADGFFFASQHANQGTGIPADVLERTGARYDLKVLEGLVADERNWFTILHLHGRDPMFDLGNRYPVHVVNWHDRESGPSIREAMRRTQKGMMAGIEREGAAASDDAAGAAAQVRDAITQSEGRRLVVSPGCVIPAAYARESTLLAVRRAAE